AYVDGRESGTIWREWRRLFQRRRTIKDVSLSHQAGWQRIAETQRRARSLSLQRFARREVVRHLARKRCNGSAGGWRSGYADASRRRNGRRRESWSNAATRQLVMGHEIFVLSFCRARSKVLCRAATRWK